jgi:rhodanese-related sulfurtransferase
MAKKHGPAFERLCDAARAHIEECTVEQVKGRLDAEETFHLIDVREESEYARDRLPGARHMGKGVIERDIEKTIPNPNADIVLYCGGGYRSALAAAALKDMGYTDAKSMAGGIRGWREKNFDLETEG